MANNTPVKPVAKVASSKTAAAKPTATKPAVKVATVKSTVTKPTATKAIVTKPAVTKAVTVKAAAKPMVKAKPVLKTKAAAKQDDKKVKPEKVKMERDSFTMPKDEYAQIAALKGRMITLGHPVKKSELLRAGIKLLAAMSDNTLKMTMEKIPAIKTGRPKK